MNQRGRSRWLAAAERLLLVFLALLCYATLRSAMNYAEALNVSKSMVADLKEKVQASPQAWVADLEKSGYQVVGPGNKTAALKVQTPFVRDWELHYVYRNPRKNYGVALFQTVEPLVIVAVSGDGIIWYPEFLRDAV